MKFKVNVTTHASATVIAEIPDEKLQKLARDLEKTVDELTEDDLTELAYEYMETPDICAQCSGWGQSWGLELGDEWDIVEGTEKYPSINRVEE